ncbi:MAG: tetratricopeptide repeat protein [Acidobacteria bacterium]|nr:tetratricopeptide repeat protein [Acidobacteriota bacterium]
MNTRNILFCAAGLAVGFLVGFMIANQLKIAAPQSSSAVAASNEQSSISVKGAPPLDPSQDTSQLPPGHPDISHTASDGSKPSPDGAAATSPDAQAAMEAADAKPNDFDAQLRAADLFARLGANDKASVYLERATVIRPKDAGALVRLGNLKYDAGDFAAAADLYTRALAARPTDADVRTDLGNTYFQRDPPDYHRAIEEYRRALAIDPRHEKALQNMASAALNLRDKATAREAVDKLASVNPNNETLASLRAALDNLP